MNQTLSAAFGSSVIEDGPVSRVARTFVSFLIRRRILLSGLLLVLLIAEDVLVGIKPHDWFNLRDPKGIGGATLVILGLCLRSWAAGILHKDTELATTGPYRLIRNPLYVGSFLMMFGFCAIIDDYENILFVLGPMLFLYILKVRSEERFLSAKFPTQWSEYARSTPRFFPRLGRIDLTGKWRVSQWMNAREYQALAVTLSALAAVKAWQVL